MSAEPAEPVGEAAAAVEPLDVDGIVPVAVGTVLWGVAAVVLLFFRDELAASGSTWWLWTCLAGFGLGLIGFAWLRTRRERRLRRQSGRQSGR